jgi:hypothetical protein
MGLSPGISSPVTRHSSILGAGALRLECPVTYSFRFDVVLNNHPREALSVANKQKRGSNDADDAN